MIAIQHSETVQEFGPGLTVQRSFSSKPPDGYADYYQKVTRYVDIIAGPALALDSGVTPRPFRLVSNEHSNSPFVYLDTNSSRGHFQDVADKFVGQKLGIVGAGGTGSYVLDLLAKTPVAEIHLFDSDLFLQHNAFRAPGAPSTDELERKPKKVDYLAGMYSRMHRGVKAHDERLDAEHLSHLEGLDFVFLCLDSGSAKKDIVEFLVKKNISFVDCGIGLHVVDHRLIGVVRVTAATVRRALPGISPREFPREHPWTPFPRRRKSPSPVFSTAPSPLHRVFRRERRYVLSVRDAGTIARCRLPSRSLGVGNPRPWPDSNCGSPASSDFGHPAPASHFSKCLDCEGRFPLWQDARRRYRQTNSSVRARGQRSACKTGDSRGAKS